MNKQNIIKVVVIVVAIAAGVILAGYAQKWIASATSKAA